MSGWTPGQTISIPVPLELGGGDAQSWNIPTTGSQIDIRVGTAAAPDTHPGPPLKVTRTMMLDASVGPGNYIEAQSAIVGFCVGVSPNVQQANGVTGIGFQDSTAVDIRNDAEGVAGVGWCRAANSVNGGLGGYLLGRRSIAAAYGIGAECQVQNLYGDDTYRTNGFPQVFCLDVDPSRSGLFNAGAAIIIGKAGDPKFDVGVGFPLFNSVGDGNGPVISADFRTDDHAAISILIKGTHTGGAIVVGDQSGAIMVGTETPAGTQVGSLAIIEDTVGSATAPILWLGSQNTPVKPHYVQLGNSSGRIVLFVADIGNRFMAGSVAGDVGVRVNAAGGSFLVGGDNTGAPVRVLQVTYDGKFGAFAHAPAAQQTVTGSRGGNAALASLLTALAAYGWVVDSSS